MKKRRDLCRLRFRPVDAGITVVTVAGMLARGDYGNRRCRYCGWARFRRRNCCVITLYILLISLASLVGAILNTGIAYSCFCADI